MGKARLKWNVKYLLKKVGDFKGQHLIYTWYKMLYTQLEYVTGFLWCVTKCVSKAFQVTASLGDLISIQAFSRVAVLNAGQWELLVCYRLRLRAWSWQCELVILFSAPSCIDMSERTLDRKIAGKATSATGNMSHSWGEKNTAFKLQPCLQSEQGHQEWPTGARATLSPSSHSHDETRSVRIEPSAATASSKVTGHRHGL